ncbi:MAG: hypothetical protein ACE5OY_04620 [Candidatus Bathyarchaeia archaeon]
MAGFLFIVGGLEKTGLFRLAGGSSSVATLVTLWSSGLASTIVSNIAIALVFAP